MTPSRLADTLDGGVRAVLRAAAWLVLPTSLLLFLQWPLREVVQAYSREVNDAAQIAFAWYVSVAITAATRSGAHVATDLVAARYPARLRARLARLGALLVLLPWSAYMLAAYVPTAVRSVVQLEGFPETFNPGYFLIRVALVALALLVLLQALLDAFRPGRPRRP